MTSTLRRQLAHLAQFGMLAAAATLAAMPHVAKAANQDVITINATVSGVCLFQSTTGTITVANSGAVIDPSLATTATGSGSIVYNCTKGQVPTFQYAVGGGALGASQPATVTLSCVIANCPAGADTMTANLTWTLPASTTGAGFSAAGNKTITLAPSVTQANFQDKTVGGPYTNTVTIAVTP